MFADIFRFVSGIAIMRKEIGPEDHEDILLLSYGVNDCEAKLGKVSMDRIWLMLQPLPGFEGSCMTM